ncbi:glutamate-ammonia-ligase adenylyltransferase [Alkalispirochaeta americana]|uniref:Glutamate-ammonia-ligase adenylyltransferase n=1 Tax=Alkalispirochaeta americana TaxID=159291 RepID=A0A1N6THI8_9SPIO|nr:hypothetical protein [Alkalispirochaeta americana]SIQ52805.1 glutamate-ammonia-ligase adenylyltransferase [Alkalispirochaeta americana]
MAKETITLSDLVQPYQGSPDQEHHNQKSADLYGFTLHLKDAPGLFSYISGILGARGFNILEGEITTAGGDARDTFRGQISPTLLEEAGGFPHWLEKTRQDLQQILAPLYQATPDPSAVRDAVAERVALAHGENREDPSGEQDRGEPLLPIEIEITGEDETTRIRVQSQDTSFFLYSLASALALQDLLIRNVQIETRDELIQDVFWVTTRSGKPVTRPEDLRRLRLSILVTKQFSHALHSAADPQEAFLRFEELVRQVALEDEGDRFRDLLANPGAQRKLARLLGASDFLWEDFIRLQYENILPLLQVSQGNRLLSTPGENLAPALEAALEGAPSAREEKRILNRFKDQEAFLIDADHILQKNTDFFFLSHRLTKLAEVVVDQAYRLSWKYLTDRYGIPRTAAGLPAHYAVFGLGKMGGSALGYASDIELMTLYSDRGETDGPEGISNTEFFENLVQGALGLIEAKREGIFRIDLRLRPYGEDGPRAVHIETFIEYFGPAGKAHSAERLALIRLRPVAGDPELGRRVIAIRDQLVYETDSISTSEIRELRLRQAREKAGDGRLNAKLSPGALVDLEYNVQLLQVSRGRTNRALRNPGIHATLRGLSQEGTLDTEETEAMIRSYRFFRTLINGLRMLRGNARDLFLPRYNTPEFIHLARRMGYSDTEDIGSADQLRIDFQVETAAIRSFVERHLGEEALPEAPRGNPADLVLSEAVSEERSSELLAEAGFRNPARAIANIRRIARSPAERNTFARLLVLAWDYLSGSSDPDMALNNWERFTEEVGDRPKFFSQLLSQPRRMEIMLRIFAGSQFLSDTLIRNPLFLEWISDPRIVTSPRNQAQMEQELLQDLAGESDRLSRLGTLRRFRKREILRIGTRDICLAGDFEDIIRELSDLARAVVEATLQEVLRHHPQPESPPGRFAILAFGKLGGGELNYSSDIDLLAIYDLPRDPPGQARTASAQPHGTPRTPRENLDREGPERFWSGVFRQVVRDISDFTVDGQAYRVDLRLRPWGQEGPLVSSLDQILEYYKTGADLWELQAAIKLAPIAGDLDLGAAFLEHLRPVFTRRLQQAGGDRILATVRTLRKRAVSQYATDPSSRDVKNGEGGIRDIEFLLQALQMLHHSLYPNLITGNTLEGLTCLEEAGLLEPDQAARLREDYRFLRRIEHFLQAYEDRQLHTLPAEPRAREKLARIVLGAPPAGQPSPDLPGELPTSELLSARLQETLQRVRGEYDRVVTESARSG